MFNLLTAAEESSGASFIVFAILTQIIATVIVFYVLKTYAYPAVRKAINERQKLIEDSLDEAKQSKLEAEELKVHIDDEKNKIRQTRKEIIEETTKSAKEEGVVIVNRSKKEAKSIIERANSEIEQEISEAKQQLSNETLELVTLVSEKFLEQKIQNQDDIKLINEALEAVENAS